jgi:PAS domain-containing protein
MAHAAARILRSGKYPFARSYHEPSLWWHLLPVAVVMAVLFGEMETPSVRITPSLLTIALAALSVFLRPKGILLWSAILFIPVIASLVYIPSGGTYEDPLAVYLRSAAFLVVSGMAYALSSTKESARRQVEELISLLDALKTPVLVTDIDGMVMFANQPCCELLGEDTQSIKSKNFFTLFGTKEARGKAVERYLAVFSDKVRKGSMQVTTNRPDGPPADYRADCSVFDIQAHPYLIAQLAPE